ncbi:MAG: class I SAM-dependent methyltransferase [Bacteroidales bacterium]|jgi:2-polyprenyl-3-methyl-5-hydroxy-6-metoxy-1,4-benzoquinol methylase|nr:class I SAM-dependent methyltransferase [Bacteroidales bacterium]
MKNTDNWKPTKYILKGNQLLATRNVNELSVSSRLMAGAIAKFYSDTVPKYAQGNLIDLGCGKVPLYELYKNYVDTVSCVDWANSSHKNQFLDFEWDLNQKLDFAEENTFETIILSDVLEHIKEPELLIKEMYRILKNKEDGSKILLNVPFYYWIHEEPYDYFRYTQFALKNMFERNGFEILELQSLGGVLEVLTDIISKYISHNSLGRQTSIAIQRITKCIGRTKIGKEIRTRTEFRFPLGFGLVVQKINK